MTSPVQPQQEGAEEQHGLEGQQQQRHDVVVEKNTTTTAISPPAVSAADPTDASTAPVTGLTTTFLAPSSFLTTATAMATSAATATATTPTLSSSSPPPPLPRQEQSPPPPPPSALLPSFDDVPSSSSSSLPSPPLPSLVLGLSLPFLQGDADEHLTAALADGFDYCTTVLPSPSSSSKVVRRDVVSLSSQQWRTSIVGILPFGLPQSNNKNNNDDDDGISSSRSHDNNNNSNHNHPNLMDTSSGTAGHRRMMNDHMTYQWDRWSETLAWAWHYSLPAVILPPLPLPLSSSSSSLASSSDASADNDANAAIHAYAAALYPAAMEAHQHGRGQLWIPVRLLSTNVREAQQNMVNIQRVLQLCQYAPAIHVLLDLDQALVVPITTSSASSSTVASAATVLSQSLQQQEQQLQMLHVLLGSTHVAAVCISTQSFLTNKRGFPTLSRQMQTIISTILIRVGRTVKWMLSGPPLHPKPRLEPAPAWGITSCVPYRDYLHHLRTSHRQHHAKVGQSLDTVEAAMERDYLDHLQKPLQPLAQHLENTTYETFEKDPVKYARYQQAIYQTALDWRRRQCHQVMTTATTATSVPVVWTIVVVGAGRGPLVTCALQAWNQACLTVPIPPATTTETTNNLLFPPPQCRVFAVEKNPSAVSYLQALAVYHPTWIQGGVQVVHTDLRVLSPAHLQGHTADLVVSELLGSFGCNELSPECLDPLFWSPTGVCRPDTLSIPCRYTSTLAPVSSIHLHRQVLLQSMFPAEDHREGIVGRQEALETPYVVRTHAASQMAPEQVCWDFSHPIPPPPSASSTMTTARRPHDRHVKLTFPPDPTYGRAYGNGYGAVDRDILLLAPPSSPPVGEEDLSWTLTGFLGTFTADLYPTMVQSHPSGHYIGGLPPPRQPTVQYATTPSVFSTGMFSWFPLYFPLATPLTVPPGATVTAEIWRKTDHQAVWYEWSAQVVMMTPTPKEKTTTGWTPVVRSESPIHNPMGRSSRVSLQTS